MTLTRQEFGVRAHKTVIHNDTVYLAGMVASEAHRPVTEQTEEILQQMEDRLARAGSDKRRLIMINIFLSDMRRFAEMNEAWDAWLDREHAPARATVEARMARPGFDVEMTAIAALE